MPHKDVEQKALQNAILIQGLKDQLLTMLKQIFSGNELKQGNAWHIKSIYDLTQLLREVASRTIDLERHPLAGQKEVDEMIQLEMTRLYWDLFNDTDLSHNTKQGLILLKSIADLIEEAASTMKSTYGETALLRSTGYSEWGQPFKAISRFEHEQAEHINEDRLLTEAKKVLTRSIEQTIAFRKKTLHVDVPDANELALGLEYWHQISHLREQLIHLDKAVKEQVDHIHPVSETAWVKTNDDGYDIDNDDYAYIDEAVYEEEAVEAKQVLEMKAKNEMTQAALEQAQTIPEKKAFLDNIITQVEAVLGESLDIMQAYDKDTLNAVLVDALKLNDATPVAIWLSQRYPIQFADQSISSTLKTFDRIKDKLYVDSSDHLQHMESVKAALDLTDHGFQYASSPKTSLDHIAVLGPKVREIFIGCVNRSPDVLKPENKPTVAQIIYRFAGHIKALNLDKLEMFEAAVNDRAMARLEVALTETLREILSRSSTPDAALADWVMKRFQEENPAVAKNPVFETWFKQLYAVPKNQKMAFKMMMAKDMHSALDIFIQDMIVMQTTTHLTNIEFLQQSPPVIPVSELIKDVSENILLGYYNANLRFQHVLWDHLPEPLKDRVKKPDEADQGSQVVSNQKLLKSMLNYFQLTDIHAYRTIIRAHAKSIFDFPYAVSHDSAAFDEYDFKGLFGLTSKITPEMIELALPSLNHSEQKQILDSKRLPWLQAVVDEAGQRQMQYHHAWAKLAECDPEKIQSMLTIGLLDSKVKAFLQALLDGQANQFGIDHYDLSQLNYMLERTIDREHPDNWFHQLSSRDQHRLIELCNEQVSQHHISSVMLIQLAQQAPRDYQAVMVNHLFGAHFLPFSLDQLAGLQKKVANMFDANPASSQAFAKFMGDFLANKTKTNDELIMGSSSSAWSSIDQVLDRLTIWGEVDKTNATPTQKADLLLYKKINELSPEYRNMVMVLCNDKGDNPWRHKERRALLKISESYLGKPLSTWSKENIKTFFSFIAYPQADYGAWEVWLRGQRSNEWLVNHASHQVAHFFDQALAYYATKDDAIKHTLVLLENNSDHQLSVPIYMAQLSGEKGFQQIQALATSTHVSGKPKPSFYKALTFIPTAAKQDPLARVHALSEQLIRSIEEIGDPLLLQALKRDLNKKDYHKLANSHILHHYNAVIGSLIDAGLSLDVTNADLQARVKAFYQRRGDSVLSIANKEGTYYKDLGLIRDELVPMDPCLFSSKQLADIEEQVEALGYQSDFVQEDELQAYWVFWRAFGPAFERLTAEGIFPVSADLDKAADVRTIKNAVNDALLQASKQHKAIKEQVSELYKPEKPIMKMVGFVNEVRLMHYAFDKAAAGEAIKSLDLPMREVVSNDLAKYKKIMTNVVPLFSVHASLNQVELSRLMKVFKAISALHDMDEKDLDTIVNKMSVEQSAKFVKMFKLHDADPLVIKAHLASTMVPAGEAGKVNDIKWILKLPTAYRLRAMVDALSTEDLDKFLTYNGVDTPWFRGYLEMSPQDKIAAVEHGSEIVNMYMLNFTNFIFDHKPMLKRDRQLIGAARHVANDVYIKHLVEQSLTDADAGNLKRLIEKESLGTKLTDAEKATRLSIQSQKAGLEIMLYQSTGPVDVLLYTLSNYFDIPKADLNVLMAHYAPSLLPTKEKYAGHVWDYDLSALLIWQHGLKNIIENNRSYHLPSIITTLMLLSSLLALVLTLLLSCPVMYVQMAATSLGVSFFMKIFVERQRVRSILTYASSDKVGLFENLATVKELVAVNQDSFMMLVDQMIKDIDLLRNTSDISQFKIQDCDSETLERKLAEYERGLGVELKPSKTHLERLQTLVSMHGNDILEVKWMLHNLDPWNDSFMSANQIKRLGDLIGKLAKPYHESMIDLYHKQFSSIKRDEIKKVFEFFDTMSATNESLTMERLLHTLPEGLQHFLYYQLNAIKQVSVQIENFEQRIVFPKGFKFSDVKSLSKDDVLRLESAEVNNIYDLAQYCKPDAFDDQSLASVEHNADVLEKISNHLKSKGIASTMMIRPKEISMFGCIDINEKVDDQSSLNKTESVFFV